MAHITVVGSLNMDLVVRTPRIPRPGETIIGHDFHLIPGGKGANQAVAAGKLRAQVSMVGRVGEDDFGKALIDNLAACGVDASCVVREAKASSGVALITVEDSGQNNIVVVAGTNMNLTPADIDAAEECIARSDMLLAQQEIPEAAVRRAFELARKHNVKTVLNPAPARPVGPDILRNVDFLVPNESETSLLTGMPVDTPEQIEAAAMALRKMGPETVIITLGARGALMASPQGVELFPSYEIQAVDTTAAGDAFMGGFAVALAEGAGLAQAIRRANAAGALSATRLGAQPSMPSRDEWDAFCRDRGC